MYVGQLMGLADSDDSLTYMKFYKNIPTWRESARDDAVLNFSQQQVQEAQAKVAAQRRASQLAAAKKAYDGALAVARVQWARATNTRLTPAQLLAAKKAYGTALESMRAAARTINALSGRIVISNTVLVAQSKARPTAQTVVTATKVAKADTGRKMLAIAATAMMFLH